MAEVVITNFAPIFQIFPINLELTIPTTVRDVSTSMTSFSGRLKAELFCRAYGTDLAPMWQLLRVCANVNILTYLLTYLLSKSAYKCRHYLLLHNETASPVSGPAWFTNFKKVKTSHFILSRRRASFDFHQVLHDDRGPPCHHCTALTFFLDPISSLAAKIGTWVNQYRQVALRASCR